MRSNLRWCSDGFEVTCWNGEIVRGAFVIDAHDREIIAWRAVTGGGISGSDVCDILRVNPLPDAETALGQFAGWFEDYNENHPHSGLRMRSPREFRRAHQPAEVSGQ